MSFGVDEFRSLQKGQFDEHRAIQVMFTELGASLYSYMVMLSNAGRKEEAEIMNKLRGKAFDLRTKFYEKTYGAEEHREFNALRVEIETIYQLLRIHKPEESVIFQSPANHCIGLGYVIKEHLKLD